MVQFIWTCYSERAALGFLGLAAALAAVGACLLGFERLRAWGAVLVGEAVAKKEARLSPDVIAPKLAAGASQ